MEKMKMHSMNKIDENVKKIAALFPECITEVINEEGKLEKVVDIDAFKQLFSKTAIEGNQERYQFTWPDKRKAKALVNQEVTSTLRPCREESVNFDATENLYIEGDNLEVLKLLQETYLGKIKMIYIDPPYNTGHDFVYEDDFSQNANDYISNSGQYDSIGNRLVENTESNGRFHTDWLNMIYPRLRLAKDLLSEDGVIFISIDDNEIDNLKKTCDEIFGSRNYIDRITIIVKPEGRRYGFFAKCHENCIVYAKNIMLTELNEIEIEGAKYQYYDSDGGFNLKGLRNRNVKAFNSLNRPNLRYPFYVDTAHPDMNGFFPVTTIPTIGYTKVEAIIIDGLASVWRWGKDTAELKRDQLVAYQGNDKEIRIFQKERKLSQLPKTVWTDKNIISNKGTKEVSELLSPGIFDFPKPLFLLQQIVQIGSDLDSLILDFFSGSATTAHAVMKLNAEDGGHRKFIMVQLPEPCKENSEAYKAGYKNICEIGKERIRRAGKQILEENNNDDLFTKEPTLDIGFRDLKLDSSNMNDIFYTPDETDQGMLDGFISNIKEDRTAEDLLFQVMLDLGVLLSAKIVEEEIEGKKIFNVDNNYLIACFDENVTENVIVEIAKRHPDYFVMRDSSLANDSVSVNFDQIFERYTDKNNKKTVRKIL